MSYVVNTIIGQQCPSWFHADQTDDVVGFELVELRYIIVMNVVLCGRALFVNCRIVAFLSVSDFFVRYMRPGRSEIIIVMYGSFRGFFLCKCVQ